MATYKVIDVSDWQGKINWAKVKADGVVGAIIRYADGTTLDKRFAENMTGALKAGLHVGAYIFSRAKTKVEAETEATRLFNACKLYKYDMPLYIDLEVAGLAKYADIVAPAFLNKMASLGAKGGVYANLNWWRNYLKKTAKDYSASPFWIAQYNDTMDYKPASVMGMWQYSSSGHVDGIPARVDMDRCYVPYWNDVSVEVEVVPTKDVVVDVELAKTVDELAQEVLDCKWGNGDDRKKRLTEAGYDYNAVQKKVNEILSKESWVDKANAWAKKIVADNTYHYVKWKSKDVKTHECPICHNHPVGYSHGWNCIGFTYACWHHGGGLACKCNDGVISNQVAERMLQMSEKDALAEARKRIGLKDLKVIINKKGIPKKEWKAGDICMHFSGNEYIHNYYYMGDGKIAESTGSSGKIPNDDQIRIKKYNNKSAKMIIRYIGK